MLDDLKECKEILKAIKVAEANINLESDMDELEIDKKELKKKLISDSEIRNKAKEKVNNNDRG